MAVDVEALLRPTIDGIRTELQEIAATKDRLAHREELLNLLLESITRLADRAAGNQPPPKESNTQTWPCQRCGKWLTRAEFGNGPSGRQRARTCIQCKAEPTPTAKFCSRCEQPRSLTEFAKHPTGKHGRASICDWCIQFQKVYKRWPTRSEVETSAKYMEQSEHA